MMTSNLLDRMVSLLGSPSAPRELWTVIPPSNTVVQVDMMRHMPVEPLPGGLYAIIGDDRSHTCCGILVVSVPRSLTKHPSYCQWTWADSFPCDLNPRQEDFMRLLHVPDHVEAAVMALAHLSDTLPVVVDDGWLC